MDNHAEIMQQEAGEIHESEIRTTESMDFIIQEKTDQTSAHEENGEIIMKSCVGESDTSGGDCGIDGEHSCIDIILPNLEESSVQNENQQEIDESAVISYENTKKNEYEFEEEQENQHVSHNQMVELDNIHVIDDGLVDDQSQVMEVDGNQMMEAHQDQVSDSCSYQVTNTTNESVIDNEQENLNSYIEDGEIAAADPTDTADVQDYELESGENGDLNPEEYSDSNVAVVANEFSDNLHNESVSDYISEEYIADKEEAEKEEVLEQSNNDDTPTDLNNEYEHLTTISEVQLSNEEVVEEEEIIEEQQSLGSNLVSVTEETYEEYSDIRDSEETTAITEIKEAEKTTAYRQDNIINMAAASANIDIQDDTSRSSAMAVDQLENQFVNNDMESSIEESVSLMLNSHSGAVEVSDNDLVDNSGAGEIIMIEKGEETASEVIEEIYFIQDVSSNNFEQNKNVSNEENLEEENQVEIVQSQSIQQDQDDSKITRSRTSIAQNSGISEKSRNVIQDIFDDWGDENVDEDHQIFSNKEHDTVEIELNNLLNENKKKMPVSSSSETTQRQGETSKKKKDDAPTGYKSAENKNSTENQTTTSAETATSATPSSTSFKKTRNYSASGKDIPSYVQPYVRGTYSSSSSTALDQDQDWVGGSNSKRKMQLPRLGVKVPSRHLKSQIASPAEVTEVLKERLREKQKDLETPQAADIVFVKKLTQRFASKICAGGTLPVPGLIPLSQPTRSGGSSGSDNSERTTTTTHSQSNENTDNRELLAILEGDVDPDWSNLKSESTAAAESNLGSEGDSNYCNTSNTTSKLNPTTERELALKQLLELPSTGNKRSKKRIFKPSSNRDEKIEKSSSETSDSIRKEKKKEKEEEKILQVEVTKDLEIGKHKKTLPSSSSQRKPLKENDSQNTPSKVITHAEMCRIEETRSGRKRKPTEKALEQYATKRQKIYKLKSPTKGEEKGGPSENNTGKDLNKIRKNSSSERSKSLNESSEDITMNPLPSLPSSPPPLSKEVTSKQPVSESVSSLSSSPPPTKDKSFTEKKLSLNLVGKKNISTPSPPFGNRKKLAATGANKLVPQRVLTLKKKSSTPTNLQSKPVVVSVVKRPVGRPAKLSNSKQAIVVMGGRSKGVKTIEVTKPKKKRRAGIKEIDKLLQDEGVVNLLYDVGQPRKRRLVPITKSQKKVMDIEKAERDLDIRKKLVKNAVLTEFGKIAHRTKRRKSPIESVDPAVSVEENSVIVTNRSKSSSSSTVTSPTEFIYPAKIRNAADASVIVRRHSSSSFSSVSGSPRVSIDAPLEGGNSGGSSKPDDETNHGLRSAGKRKLSSVGDKDAKNHQDSKKSKQQKVSSNAESTLSSKDDNDKLVVVVTDVSKEKIPIAKKQRKLSIVEKSNSDNNNKKVEKSSRSSSEQSDGSGESDIEGDSESKKVHKVMTRSNGSAGLKKLLPKNQKKKAAFKDKSSSAVSNDSNVSNTSAAEVKGVVKSQDELSACLAEAATALSSVSGESVGDGISRRTNLGGTTVGIRKNKGSSSVIKTQSDNTTNDSNHTKSESSKPLLLGNHKEINISRNGNLVQLILTPSSTKMINGITLEVMQELCNILTILKTDQECRVVLLTSSGGTSFCEGLDLSTLLHTDKVKRKTYAEKMANAVKEFIKCLASFNKPLVAGVQGAAVGLGVTILPLFDLVIASDKATFYTPYGKLGQIPEGAAIMTLSHVHGSAVASELLLGGRTLTASEALRAGLVTRVLWPDRFPLELLPSVKAMSEQSSQSMEATKALLRQSLRNKLSAALESETHILVQHWCSAECQEAIKAYIMRKVE